jgi:CelD/BcsL family acetyltransferase involved in cellulose biosynthesis
VDEFELGELDGPRPSSRFLAERISGYRVAAARRSNYRVLLEELEHLVPPPFQEVPEGASPFAFPVATGAKRELIDRLHDGRIRPLDFWSFPHPALPERRFPHAAERRATTVCLPVHQELRPDDVERIVRIVRGRERPRHNGERVEWYHDLDAVRDEWRTLAEQTRSIFATWEWAALWWDCFGGDRRPLLGLCRRDSGEPFALLPLYAARERPLKVLRFIGHSTADELGPVCAPADRAGAGRALRTALGQCGADILLADRLPGVEHWRSLLGGGQLLKREAAPVIEWNEGWASYLRSRSRNFREQVRRRARRLGEAHKVEFRLSSGGDRNPDVDILFLLHTARWDAETTFTRHERFHREFAAAAAREGWLRLWVLEVDGVPAAAWYGFRFSGVESYFQLGRDPRFAKASVGFVLLAHTVEQALDDRITEYRFLWGAEPYKYRFATGDRGLETVAVARGIASQAAVASGRLVRPLAWTRAVVRAGLSAGSD